MRMTDSKVSERRVRFVHASVENADPGEPTRIDCADTDAAVSSTLIWPVA
jgi:hypothetical protein